MSNLNTTQEYLSTLTELENQVAAVNDLLSRALANATKTQDLSSEVFWSNQLSPRLADLFRDVSRIQDKVKALSLVLPRDTDLESINRWYTSQQQAMK